MGGGEGRGGRGGGGEGREEGRGRRGGGGEGEGGGEGGEWGGEGRAALHSCLPARMQALATTWCSWATC